MVDGGAQGPTTEDHLGKPRCPGYWTCGAQQDCRPHQKSFLVAWYVEHHGGMRAVLSGLLVGEIRPLEEGRSHVDNPITRTEVATNYYRPGYRFPKSNGKTTIAVFVDRL